MRGKVACIRRYQRPPGITPAHAGKSQPHMLVVIIDRDHPRACGEKKFVSPCVRVCLGSPPRMRGKGRRQHTLHHRRGITPAHAGKSNGDDHERRNARDHPRACGEKAFRACICPSPLGSPPRMRGKEIAQGGSRHTFGITPAHAGKSICHTVKLAGNWDHPRACGEKLASNLLLSIQLGSPPRMRGKAALNVWHAW